MKRSQMLQLIATFIEGEYAPRSDEGLNLSLASAVALLDLIEDVGMLPPYDASTDYSDRNYHEWEPE